jgi:hypothetical protein
MTLHALNIHARPFPDGGGAVRATPREDANWSRPVFRPPPLEIHPFRAELPYSGTIQRTEPWASWPRASASPR